MNLMADECIDRQIVDRLREEGHEVLYMAEMNPSIPDETILERASQKNALLLKADKEFWRVNLSSKLYFCWCLTSSFGRIITN